MIAARYQFGEAEYLRGIRLFNRNRRRLLLFLPAVVILAATIAAGVVINPAWFQFTALFVFIFVAMRFFTRWFNLRIFRSHPDLSSEISLELSDEGTSLRTATSEASRKWSAYIQAVEDDDFFVLLTGPYAFTMIPKRAFVASDLDAARTLIASKVRLTSRG